MRISGVTIAINPGAPFSGELALVAMQKARNPRVRNVLFRNYASEISYYLSRRWQASLGVSFYILHELRLLLWVK